MSSSISRNARPWAPSLVPLAVLLFFFLELGTASADAQAQDVRQNRESAQSADIPQDPRYWQFYRWYVGHSVVSLVVSGEDPRHLLEVLQELERLKNRGVMIGEVAVIGSLFNPRFGAQAQLVKALHPSAIPAIEGVRRIFEELGLESVRFEDRNSLLKRLEASHSPVWVVRHRGTDHVYAGVRSISNVFDSQGNFRDR